MRKKKGSIYRKMNQENTEIWGKIKKDKFNFLSQKSHLCSISNPLSQECFVCSIPAATQWPAQTGSADTITTYICGAFGAPKSYLLIRTDSMCCQYNWNALYILRNAYFLELHSNIIWWINRPAAVSLLRYCEWKILDWADCWRYKGVIFEIVTWIFLCNFT